MREIISTFIHRLCFGEVLRVADCDFPAKKTKGNLPWVRIPVSPLGQDSFPNDLTRDTRCTRVTPMTTDEIINTVRVQRNSQDRNGSVIVTLERYGGQFDRRATVDRGRSYLVGEAPYMLLKNFKTDKEFVFVWNWETQWYEINIDGATIATTGIHVIA